MAANATSRGYFVSYDEEVLKSQIYSLRQRASSINNSANGLEYFLKQKGKKQE